MPRGDGTGPMGNGSMTGRGAGYCAGYNVPGFANPSVGRGMAWGKNAGCGRGRGLGRNMAAPVLQDVPVKPKPEASGTVVPEPESVVHDKAEEISGVDVQEEIKGLKSQVDFISKSLGVVLEKLDSLGKIPVKE